MRRVARLREERCRHARVLLRLGLGFRVRNLGFSVDGVEFGVWDSECRGWGVGSSV